MANFEHKWDVSPKEAIEIQKNLAAKVQLIPYTQNPKWIGGADISFEKYSDEIYAGIVILDATSLEVVAGAIVKDIAPFPYVPGLLSFREIPAVYEAWSRLPWKPDVMIMDGQGIAHPRRFGLAAHFGLLADVPAIGCAKTRFIGKFDPPGETAGDFSPLMDKEEQVGVVLRTKDKVNPVFVSPGHKMDMESAIRVMKLAFGKYRIPEPTRQAHIYVNEVRSGEREPGVWGEGK